MIAADLREVGLERYPCGKRGGCDGFCRVVQYHGRTAYSIMKAPLGMVKINDLSRTVIIAPLVSCRTCGWTRPMYDPAVLQRVNRAVLEQHYPADPVQWCTNKMQTARMLAGFIETLIMDSEAGAAVITAAINEASAKNCERAGRSFMLAVYRAQQARQARALEGGEGEESEGEEEEEGSEEGEAGASGHGAEEEGGEEEGEGEGMEGEEGENVEEEDGGEPEGGEEEEEVRF